MSEIFNLKFGTIREQKGNWKKPKFPPIVLTRQFPTAKLYRDYLREWMAKLPRRDDKAIRRRMEKERGEKVREITDKRRWNK